MSHGPVVGGVTATTANVFVRTSQAADVQLRYGTSPNLDTYTTTISYSTHADSDFTKIIPLTTLTGETTYYLNVVVNGVPQRTAPPFATFKTFAAPGTVRDFSFVVLTDFTTVKSLTEPTTTFMSASAESPAFAFIGGDFDHRNPHSLTDKRTMFQELYNPATPFMSDFVPLILEKMPIVHQWDDHDAGVNNLDRTYPDWSLSQQVFQEYVPSYPLPNISPAGIWQKFSYAQADFFVLDCRSQRDPENDRDGPDKSMLDGNNLGAAGELAWLENGLLASTARWKIIFTSVIANPTTKFPDGWAGYQVEWKSLSDFITSHNIGGIVFISGDLHLGAIDSGVASGFPEMCVAAANSQKGTDERCSTSPEGTWSEGYFEDPCSGYGLVTITSAPVETLTLKAVDETGNVRTAYTLADEPPPTPTPTPTPAPPQITMQPKSARVVVGASAKFRVTATSDLPLRYQWEKNSIVITGATNATYTTPPTTLSDNGALFSVLVSSDSGSVMSNGARLSVRSASALN